MTRQGKSPGAGDIRRLSDAPRSPLADNTVIRLDHTAEFVVWLTEIAAAVQ
jgi:hypothetical protein